MHLYDVEVIQMGFHLKLSKGSQSQNMKALGNTCNFNSTHRYINNGLSLHNYVQLAPYQSKYYTLRLYFPYLFLLASRSTL